MVYVYNVVASVCLCKATTLRMENVNKKVSMKWKRKARLYNKEGEREAGRVVSQERKRELHKMFFFCLKIERFNGTAELSS